MSINSRSAKSIRKTDLPNQIKPNTAYKALQFAHEATAGQVLINLASLTTPASMSAQGFLQASITDLQAARLLFARRSLRLVSSLRGELWDFDSYRVTSSTTIALNFAAEDGEIFVGTISDVAKSGLRMVDASPLVSTGTLPAGQTDFVVGQSFQLNKYPLMQAGDALVYLDGQLMFRNVGNATAGVSADGNYQELDGGSNLCNTIRFNSSFTDARAIMIVSNGLSVERAEGSAMAVVESLAGQIDKIIPSLAAVTGAPVTDYQAAPNSVDLRTFGGRVLGLEAKAVSQTSSTDGFARASSNLGSLRVHTTNGYGSSNTRTRRFTTIVLSQGTGFVFNQSAVSGDDVTITENGVYAFHYTDAFSVAANFGLSKNSTQLQTDITAITPATRLCMATTATANFAGQVSWTGYLVAGDVIRTHTDTAASGTDVARASLSVQKLS